MSLGDKCSTSCRTKDHRTFGECMRSKNVKVADVNYTVAAKKHSKELGAYESARKQGIQPKSTRQRDIDRAVQTSDKTGTAYRADE